MKVITYLFFIIIFVIIVFFSLINSQIVTLHYFYSDIQLPLVIALALAWCFGLIIGYLVGRCRSRRKAK